MAQTFLPTGHDIPRRMNVWYRVNRALKLFDHPLAKDKLFFLERCSIMLVTRRAGGGYHDASKEFRIDDLLNWEYLSYL